MIYDCPPADSAVDQGDLIDGCPILDLKEYRPGQPAPWDVDYGFRRVIVMTQTCDLANDKTTVANVAEVVDAQQLIDASILKAADVKGPLRSGRIWGYYFLPAHAESGLPEMVVDLRRLHTVRLELLRTLCRGGHRRARLQPLYREHLAKHFADTFSRIGLPRPYETL
jgi:hypothetical protein